MVAPGSQRADVEAFRAHGELEVLVVDVADVGQRHHGGIGVETDLRDRVLRRLGVQADAGKTRLGGEGRARVDHRHLVTGDLHQLRQDLADVGGADDDDGAGGTMACTNTSPSGDWSSSLSPVSKRSSMVGVGVAVVTAE